MLELDGLRAVPFPDDLGLDVGREAVGRSGRDDFAGADGAGEVSREETGACAEQDPQSECQRFRAIAIECRDGDAAVIALCAALDDAPTRTCVGAERAMNLALHGSCHVPVAAFARLEGEHMFLSGLVGSAIDGRHVRAQAQGRGDAPEALGLAVAESLLAQGARALIDAPDAN